MVFYFLFQLKRYKTYAYLLRSRISQYPELEGSLVESSIGEAMECDEDETPSLTNNRYSYRAAIYSRDTLQQPDIG